MKKNALDLIAMILVIIGAINWGFVGLLEFDLVKTIFGTGTLTKIIYILVGISGVYSIYFLTK